MYLRVSLRGRAESERLKRDREGVVILKEAVAQKKTLKGVAVLEETLGNRHSIQPIHLI